MNNTLNIICVSLIIAICAGVLNSISIMKAKNEYNLRIKNLEGHIIELRQDIDAINDNNKKLKAQVDKLLESQTRTVNTLNDIIGE